MKTIDDHIADAVRKLSELKAEKRELEKISIGEIPRLTEAQHRALREAANDLVVSMTNANKACSFGRLKVFGLVVSVGEEEYRHWNYRITPKGWKLLQLLSLIESKK